MKNLKENKFNAHLSQIQLKHFYWDRRKLREKLILKNN